VRLPRRLPSRPSSAQSIGITTGGATATSKGAILADPDDDDDDEGMWDRTFAKAATTKLLKAEQKKQQKSKPTAETK
jgi:hypothetical protein